LDLSGGGADQSHQHVKTGGFTGTVWTQEAHHFTGPDTKINSIDNISVPIPFDEAVAGQ
jgi:hypothetical protein